MEYTCPALLTSAEAFEVLQRFGKTMPLPKSKLREYNSITEWLKNPTTYHDFRIECEDTNDLNSLSEFIEAVKEKEHGIGRKASICSGYDGELWAEWSWTEPASQEHIDENKRWLEENPLSPEDYEEQPLTFRRLKPMSPSIEDILKGEVPMPYEPQYDNITVTKAELETLAGNAPDSPTGSQTTTNTGSP